MRAAILRAKPRERRIAIVAFWALFFVIGSHALLETARDALFLAKVSASKLPWLYILIAIASVIVTQVGGRLRVSSARSLTFTIGATSLITLALGWLLPQFPVAGSYVLYVWTGVLIAVVLMRFWILLGGLFTVTQAKALYGFVGMGSVTGAIAGSAAARALSELVPAGQLVYAGGISLGLGSAITLFFWREGAVAADVDEQQSDSMRDCVRYVFEHRYARRVALLIAVAAMALTVVDYIFKTIVAERVPPDELGSFFATVYLALNVGSLVIQVVVVSWLIRRFNTLGALAVLPTLILVGALGLVALPAAAGLVAALTMKGIDGVMRHTLNRTANELLFVPLPSRGRSHLKLFGDVISQKGGQAFVSIAILGLGALGWEAVLPWALVALLLLWHLALLSTRSPYLSLVRSRLRRGAHAEGLPELDVESLEALVRALDSADDGEVREAMRMLVEEDKADLIPTLILYHPSDAVAIDALDIFARSERHATLDNVNKLAEVRSYQVRSAALRTAHVLGDDIDFEAMAAESDSLFVKATCICALSTKRELSQEEHLFLHNTTLGDDPKQLVSLARDMAVFSSETLAPYLETLCNHDDEQVRQAAMGAIDVERFASHDRLLLGALADGRTRNLARRIVGHAGPKTASLVIDSLADPSVDLMTRRHLPSAIADLPDHAQAAKVLVAQLRQEEDGLIRFWILRSLNRLLDRHPEAYPDLAWVDSEIDRTLERAYRLLSRAVVLASHAPLVGGLPGHRMLVRLLRDKHMQCVGRIFILLDIRSKRENFISIWNSLRGKDTQMRDAALEMIDNVLAEPLRSAIRGLVGDFSDAERLTIGERYHKHESRTYFEVLDELDRSQSESSRELATSHREELAQLDAVSFARLGEVARAA